MDNQINTGLPAPKLHDLSYMPLHDLRQIVGMGLCPITYTFVGTDVGGEMTPDATIFASAFAELAKRSAQTWIDDRGAVS